MSRRFPDAPSIMGFSMLRMASFLRYRNVHLEAVLNFGNASDNRDWVEAVEGLRSLAF